jgi:uncharacterized small protein (DUF1192 family)
MEHLLAVVLLLQAATAQTPPVATPTPTARPGQPSLAPLAERPLYDRGSGGQSLADVAKRIKLRLPADQPRVITNESVKELARGVELTMTNAPVLIGVDAGGGGVTGRQNTDNAKKAMWQQRYREALGKVSEFEAKAASLEQEIARLQADFYSRDDPAYRDGVIKPALDKARADLEETRRNLTTVRSEPDRVIQDARGDGALPGWFRGIEAGSPPPPPGDKPTPTESRRSRREQN